MTVKQQNQTFLDWIGRHGATLWKIARINAPYGEHKDLHQDLLIAVWESVPLFREQSLPSTFIYRVACNRALNWIRDREQNRRRLTPLDDLKSPPVAPQSNNEQEQQVAQLYALLAALPETDRALALLYLEDLSYREIAEVLGITETNVGVKLNRIKKRLAQQQKETHK